MYGIGLVTTQGEKIFLYTKFPLSAAKLVQLINKGFEFYERHSLDIHEGAIRHLIEENYRIWFAYFPEVLVFLIMSKQEVRLVQPMTDVQKRLLKIAGRGTEIKIDFVQRKTEELLTYFSSFHKKAGFLSKPWVEGEVYNSAKAKSAYLQERHKKIGQLSFLNEAFPFNKVQMQPVFGESNYMQQMPRLSVNRTSMKEILETIPIEQPDVIPDDNPPQIADIEEVFASTQTLNTECDEDADPQPPTDILWEFDSPKSPDPPSPSDLILDDKIALSPLKLSPMKKVECPEAPPELSKCLRLGLVEHAQIIENQGVSRSKLIGNLGVETARGIQIPPDQQIQVSVDYQHWNDPQKVVKQFVSDSVVATGQSTYSLDSRNINCTSAIIEYQINTNPPPLFPLSIRLSYDRVIDQKFCLYIDYEVLTSSTSPISNCLISVQLTDPLAEVQAMNIQGVYADYKLTWKSAPLFPSQKGQIKAEIKVSGFKSIDTMQAPPIEVVRVSYNAEYSLISGINAKLD